MLKEVEIGVSYRPFRVRVNESPTGQTLVPTVFHKTSRRIGAAVNGTNKLNRYVVPTTFMPLVAARIPSRRYHMPAVDDAISI